MAFRRCVCYLSILCAGLCAGAWAQTTPIDVGTGSPTPLIQLLYQQAYYRNGFANQVSLPPLGVVKKIGTNGLVQEFSDAKNTPNVKLALVMPNQNAAVLEGGTYVFQMQSVLYTYWNSVGVTTAGMPVIDTATCPPLLQSNTCQYQLFDKPYALFVYANLVNLTATNFFTRDPYYTRWASYGGIGIMGPAVTAETAVTSTYKVNATAQTFDRGALYNTTSGVNSGKLFGVKQPVWDVYTANNAHVGRLGLPVSEELVTTNGHRRQSFEGGAIEYDPVSGQISLLPSVAAVNIVGASPVRLKLGDTATVSVNLADSTGNPLTGRAVLWTTSDSRIVSITANGSSATLKGQGGGTATVRASSEGKTSAALTVVVTSVCCAIGEGAPSSGVTQAFQDAATRNRLSLQLPAASAVTRTGAGYLQQFQASDGSGPIWIAVPDKVATGVVIQGKLLSAWLALGGPAGSLGYPVADATPGGRQMFENGALAGDPAQVVSGDLLSKWAILGYETGPAGAPTGAPAPFLTFRATPGQSQPFRTAALYQAGGKVLFSAGPILAAYLAYGGPAGRIGAPLNDEYGLNGRRRQDFEGGFIDYAPGDAIAKVTENARQPIVTALPASVVAGSTVRLAAGGFDSGATLKVSVSGQSDFQVTADSGAYVWDVFVPASAKSGIVTVRAVDAANPTRSAQATYTVRAPADIRPSLAVVRGDNQTGAPGALLPNPLRISLKDESGNPLAGFAVQFSASPGAKIERADTFTDANGEAAARLRLQANAGITLATARAGGQVATFNARAAQYSLANFPKLAQAAPGAAMTAAVASLLRFGQSRGDFPTASGAADPAGLDAYLKSFCVADTAGAPVCDGYLSDTVVNLWRVGGSVNNGASPSVEKADLATIRDLVAQGQPALLALSLNGAAHFVVATGVADNGDILTYDPDPAFAQTSLAAYGATLTGVARFVPGASKAAFLVAATGAVDVNSPAGVCGQNFELPTPSGSLRLRACDGAAPLYQVDIAGAGYNGSFTALGNPANRADVSGSGPSSFLAVQDSGVWTLRPVSAAIAPGGIVNAADFSTATAPGGIVSVFGAGFGAAGSTVTAQVNGVNAAVLNAFPFQLNIQVPYAVPPGPATLTVTSDAGSDTQPFTVSPVAPAIFVLGTGQGAVVNRDGTVNSPTNPARRGDVIVAFGTGFGTVSAKGNLMVTDAEVKAFLADTEVPVLFSGLTPGYPGLYQVNVSIPSSVPPGLRLRFSVRQGNSTSKPVEVAVQ